MSPLARQYLKQRQTRYRKARETARRLTQVLQSRYHAGKVVLVGSLTRENSFGEHSDIDLCVSGIDPARFFTAVGELLVEAGEFEVDLVPMEEATPEMQAVIAQGEVLYDKHA